MSRNAEQGHYASYRRCHSVLSEKQKKRHRRASYFMESWAGVDPLRKKREEK